MRYSLLIAILLTISSVQAQNFEDDFSDGDFTSNPAWYGDIANFVIFDQDGNNVIRLDDAGGVANTSYLSTPSTFANGYWEFWVQIDGSLPSGSNNIQVFVMSDNADLTGSVNGYAVRAGETGDDVFRIVRYDAGSESSVVVSDTTILQSGTSYRVRVDRDISGNWSIQVGEGYFGELNNTGNTGTDNTYSTATHFGFLVNYTSSRTNDFYFDFKIDPPPVIVEPLFIDSFNVFSETELDLTFSRDIDFASVSTTDFTLNGATNPRSFSNQGSNALRLTFSEDFPGGENELDISGIESATNDTTLTDTTLAFYQFDPYESGDVIINEFLKDPPTGSGLSEYVELYNTSSRYLNLKDWEIGDNNSLTTISDEDLVILPDSFLVVSSDPAALLSVFGPGEYVDVSLPALNNTTDQVRLLDQSGNLIDSLEYNPDWGGVDVALERRSPDVATTLQPNWGDSPVQIGTPGRTNDVQPDTTPPDLESFSFLNDSTIQLVFNEQILQGPAETPDNYNIAVPTKINPEAGENEFLTATFFAPDTVVLEFKISLYTGQFENSLLILNQEDVFGNTANVIERMYRLVQTEEALPGDVVINEFMYDPATGYSEFVELYNPTFKSFNLKGWTLSDNTGNKQVISDEDFFMQTYGDAAPSGNPYVFLVPDNTIAGTDENRIIMGSRFPTLNNSTDAIVLKNAKGVVIDSLTYTSDWGGEEVSLERRTANVSGTFQANWGDSPSTNFATPGVMNEIGQDVTPPEVISVTIPDEQTIRIMFSEQLEEANATDPDNYATEPALNFTDITLEQNVVTLTSAATFSDGQQIQLTIQNQQDIFGNVLSSVTRPAVYFEISQALPGDIVVNEILYRRTDELSPEFIELFNNTDKNFDVSGWTITDAGNNTGEVAGSQFLPAGGFLVLTDLEDFANNLQNGVYLSGFPSLNDSGDEIVIRNEQGVTIDSLFYRDTWGGNEPGVSLERKDPGRASNDASNWATSTAPLGFSAGSESSVFELDQSPPEIIFANQKGGMVEIVFSEFVEITSETVIEVNGFEQGILEFDPDNANRLVVEYVSPSAKVSQNEFFDQVVVSNLRDVKGNLADNISSPIALPISPSTIRINEIMFDPLADDEDNLPDQTEYVELYNTGSSAVSLEAIALHDAPDENDEVREITPVSSEFKWIPAGGYFLIYAEDQNEEFEESRVYEYFSLEGETDQFTMRVDRSSLSLAASGDAIYLADSTGATIDSVFYDESWQNPNLFDTDGIALEKIDPNGPSNDESNWSSSTHVSGGTPNAENSIFQEAGTTPDNLGITFTPNPFSPDDDGFEDNLFINYTLDAPDYLLRVRIFDRYGRLVRELADGYQAGFEGSLIWDGLTDDRRRNRVGIYIVLFEAYNSAEGKDRTFKETVVLARMF